MSNYLSTNGLEVLATLFGIINLWLCIRANIWNWFFGILMVSIYAYIFFKVKLYADMSFQLVALTMQFYGLFSWFKTQNNAKSISKTTIKLFIKINFAILFLTLFIAYILFTYTDSNTVTLDAFTTAASLVALWMQSKKILSHWILWIIIDIVSIQMYLIKDLYFTTGLYLFFIILNIFGYRAWLSQIHKSKSINPQFSY